MVSCQWTGPGGQGDLWCQNQWYSWWFGGSNAEPTSSCLQTDHFKSICGELQEGQDKLKLLICICNWILSSLSSSEFIFLILPPLQGATSTPMFVSELNHGLQLYHDIYLKPKMKASWSNKGGVGVLMITCRAQLSPRVFSTAYTPCCRGSSLGLMLSARVWVVQGTFQVVSLKVTAAIDTVMKF